MSYLEARKARIQLLGIPAVDWRRPEEHPASRTTISEDLPQARVVLVFQDAEQERLCRSYYDVVHFAHFLAIWTRHLSMSQSVPLIAEAFVG